MKKYLLIYAMGATLLLIASVALLRHSQSEVARLRNNNEALQDECHIYRTRSEESAASVVALQLQLKEFRRQHRSDVERIRQLGVRLRRVESVAKSSTSSAIKVAAPLRDTIVIERLIADTLTLFDWSDKWVRLEGRIRGGEVECHIESVDTLHQIIHRVPHRWLCFRFGTKAIRQEIASSNPHTRILYTEYIELPKRRRRR